MLNKLNQKFITLNTQTKKDRHLNNERHIMTCILVFNYLLYQLIKKVNSPISKVTIFLNQITQLTQLLIKYELITFALTMRKVMF